MPNYNSGMNPSTQLQAVQAARRMVELERRANKETIQGLISGTVIAQWKELNEDGSGRVLYEDREFVVNPSGFISLPKGTKVQMTYGEGVYHVTY
jgi:hypothetical protein